ncbi:DUF4113 domain-containing protein [Methylobacterium dankookense]|uniref:DUF4113 domain-containing protein n=1 Tax=Methylobacterium dankookense TaxID=560405 RepID=UPI001EE007CC|nr:DUF4113 domain-containing protein [Methylobacterium dankookense]
MALIDACNAHLVRGAVVPARSSIADQRAWSTKFEIRTPRQTTQVEEVVVA